MSGGTELARAVFDACVTQGVMLATAESCTGGMVAAAITDLAGSSQVLDRGFVTYSNEAKMEMLGVSQQTLARFGAVSRETAVEMAEGALRKSRAGIAVSITGIAGPGGGSTDKPVGLVWFAVARTGFETLAEQHLFEDHGRASIRLAARQAALELVLRGCAATR